MIKLKNIPLILKSTFLVLFVHTVAFSQEQVFDELDSIYFNEHFFDYAPDFTYEEIEDRISCIPTTIPLHFNETVKSFVDYFTVRNRVYTQSVIDKHTYWFPLFEKYLAKYNMPDELKYLAIVESGLNPKAVSRAGAVGLWQFMPRTARLEFGLTEDWYMDEKMDPEKATDAACRYLLFLYNYFNDWELALAAYNSGAGNVRKAIRKSGGKTSFWEVYPYLLRETRSYVPQFTAIVYALNYAEEHNFLMDKLRYMPETKVMELEGFISLKIIAEKTTTDIELLRALNPELRKDVIPPYAKKYPLKIPTEKDSILLIHMPEIVSRSKSLQEEFEKLAQNTPGSVYGREKIVHTVSQGDVLGKIAGTYGVRIVDIQEWNKMSGTTIYVGQKLNIWILPSWKPSQKQAVATPAAVPAASIKQIQTADSGTYIVESGDTLWDISKKFEGMTVEKLKQLNGLKTNQIKVGMVLKVGDS